MTILSSLYKAYERLAVTDEVPLYGSSKEKISYVISLNPDGSPAFPPHFIGSTAGNKNTPRLMAVPKMGVRTSGIAPYFLWDKSAYVLGVALKESERTAQEHRAFVDYHVKHLGNTKDEGLTAFLAFLQNWSPEKFREWNWPENMKDLNIVFALETQRLKNIYLHNRPAAQEIWADMLAGGQKTKFVCLVTGEKGYVARLHPGLRGVPGAQSSGAALVSFNCPAFESYGHEQGDNAPVSEKATFAYTAVLSKFLEQGSQNRIQIGDTAVVFWAGGSGAKPAENLFACFFGHDAPLTEGGGIDDGVEAQSISYILERVRNGQSVSSFDPRLSEGVRFYILGLDPNKGRISVRFWMEETFGAIAKNYTRFLQEMRLDAGDRASPLALTPYLRETAVQRKLKNVPPLLAGQWMHSILTGAPYPVILMSVVLTRIRADQDINTRRVSILKAILVRNFNRKEEALVSLDPENRNKGYLLGRLFSVYERIQWRAHGGKVNATIKDRFYGSASMQPQRIFPSLDRGATHHLSKIGKHELSHRITLENHVRDIMGLMSPNDNPFPILLSREEQALFALGYYHQRKEFFKPKSKEETQA